MVEKERSFRQNIIYMDTVLRDLLMAPCWKQYSVFICGYYIVRNERKEFTKKGFVDFLSLGAKGGLFWNNI